MKLILGTAEFGPNPYGEGVKKPPTEKEIIRILNLAWEAGIRTLDTAESYGCSKILNKYGHGFRNIIKSRCPGLVSDFYHYKPGEKRIDSVKKASVYDIIQIPDSPYDVIIPFNINNTVFSSYTHFIIRSVFDRGRLLKQGYTIKDCLSFVKRAEPNGVIVGVNSVKELDQILQAWG